MEQNFTVTIDSLVYEGKGLARLPDGKAVFVPFVLPGEEADIRLLEEKKHFAFAELIEVRKPSSMRTAPRCRHFGFCGGCHYQHIPYLEQLRFKQEIFLEQLDRIGHIQPQKIDEILPSSRSWNYRDSLQVHVSMSGQLCFMDIYNNKPFAVEECHLPMQEINRVWPQVEFEIGDAVDRVEYRQNIDGEVMLILSGDQASVPEVQTEATISVVHMSDEDELLLAGDDFLVQKILDKPFRVSAGAFFQTNLFAAEEMVRIVQNVVKTYGRRKIMDIYCGVGLFSSFLAESADGIIAIESSPEACDDFAVNLDEYNHVVLYQGDAGEILPMIDAYPDCIIVDPPRTGLGKEVLQQILEMNSDLLLYVSCNPATLARDATYLNQGGFILDSSRLVDMFPQNYHIESINIFLRESQTFFL